jgi:hypothetical protein
LLVNSPSRGDRECSGGFRVRLQSARNVPWSRMQPMRLPRFPDHSAAAGKCLVVADRLGKMPALRESLRVSRGGSKSRSGLAARRRRQSHPRVPSARGRADTGAAVHQDRRDAAGRGPGCPDCSNRADTAIARGPVPVPELRRQGTRQEHAGQGPVPQMQGLWRAVHHEKNSRIVYRSVKSRIDLSIGGSPQFKLTRRDR